MNGDLAEGTLARLLREAYVGRLNGQLHLTRGGERHSLRFRRGHIVNATTNVLEDRLGEMLVRRGMLSPADLARATEIVVREKKRLGFVLNELGLIDRSGLEDAIALHVHEMLAKVFSWDEGTFVFEPEDDAPGVELTLKLSTGELILEAVQAVKDPDVVRYSLGDLDRVLALSPDPLLRFQKLQLSPTDGYVLSRVDGTTSAHEIVQMIPLPAEAVERSLLGLLSTGVIEYVAGTRKPRPAPGSTAAPAGTASSPDTPPPPADDAPSAPPPAPAASPPEDVAAAPPEAPEAEASPPSPDDDRRREVVEAFEGLKTRSLFEVLGVPRSATEADVKDAYFRLAKRFHPDAHHGESLADLRDALEAVFIRLGEAYETLRDPRRRADYEQRLGRARASGSAPPGAPRADVPPPEPPPPPDPEAEAAQAEYDLRRAAILYEKEQYWDAIQLLEPAVEKLAPRLRSRGRVLLARCDLKNPKWVKRAEEILLQVTREDPKAVDAWSLLGGLYAEKGMQARAQSMYRRVLEISPEHEEALKFLATVPPPEAADPEPPPGGLLRKLFRKG
jgi:tetratricopeptide (TPR) repeat protein